MHDQYIESNLQKVDSGYRGSHLSDIKMLCSESLLFLIEVHVTRSVILLECFVNNDYIVISKRHKCFIQFLSPGGLSKEQVTLVICTYII